MNTPKILPGDLANRQNKCISEVGWPQMLGCLLWVSSPQQSICAEGHGANVGIIHIYTRTSYISTNNMSEELDHRMMPVNRHSEERNIERLRRSLCDFPW